jgi:quinol-cytochrome oxidoreductase complex cytochrome b subunit
MAVETNADAYLPVSIILVKLHLEIFFEKLFSNFFSSTDNESRSNTKENNSPTIDFDSSWDLYLMIVLLGLLGALYTIRRQRVALREQAAQVPVQ